MAKRKTTAVLTLIFLICTLLYTMLIIFPKAISLKPETEKLGFNLNFNYETIINASDYPGENDTERLQAALDDVPPEGATVIIPPGVWTACGLIAKSRTVIQGFNGTIIERPANKTAPFITFENRSEFAIFNITFDSKSTPEAYGIRIIDSKLFVISHNDFLNIEESAIKVLVTLDGTCENFNITYNYFKNANMVPIFLFGSPDKRRITNFIISDNTIINGTVNGKIGVAFASNGIIANNTIKYTQYGIATRCVSNLKIEGNLIDGFADYGIYLGTQIANEGTINVTIHNNTIINGYIGISKYYGSEYDITQITVSNNYFVNNSLYDISADFPAYFLNNVITSPEKLIILHPSAYFKGTKTLSGQIVMPGDLDGNLLIDIVDVARIAIAYGSVPGNEAWNPEADIIADQKIDIQDVAYAASLFGSSEN